MGGNCGVLVMVNLEDWLGDGTCFGAASTVFALLPAADPESFMSLSTGSILWKGVYSVPYLQGTA